MQKGYERVGMSTEYWNGVPVVHGLYVEHFV